MLRIKCRAQGMAVDPCGACVMAQRASPIKGVLADRPVQVHDCTMCRCSPYSTIIAIVSHLRHEQGWDNCTRPAEPGEVSGICPHSSVSAPGTEDRLQGIMTTHSAAPYRVGMERGVTVPPTLSRAPRPCAIKGKVAARGKDSNPNPLPAHLALAPCEPHSLQDLAAGAHHQSPSGVPPRILLLYSVHAC